MAKDNSNKEYYNSALLIEVYIVRKAILCPLKNENADRRENIYHLEVWTGELSFAVNLMLYVSLCV